MADNRVITPGAPRPSEVPFLSASAVPPPLETRVQLSLADYAELMRELDELRSRHRGELAQRLRDARDFGSPGDADDRLAPLILELMATRRFDAPLIMEGGSIHTDGEGTLLSTEECLLNRNRNPSLSKAEIESYLRDYLGVDTFVWLKKGLPGDETDGHVDNIACFAAPGLVAMQAPSSDGNEEGDPLAELSRAKDAAGRRLDIVPIPQPPERRCRGERLTLSYINYYPVSGGLVVPVFGKDGEATMRASDDRALGILRELYPDRKIVAVDGMKIIKGGGNVHCITQQIPAAGRRA